MSGSPPEKRQKTEFSDKAYCSMDKQMTSDVRATPVTAVQTRRGACSGEIKDGAITISDLTSRSYNLWHIDWDAATQDQTLDLVALVTSNANINQNLTRVLQLYTYFKFDMELTFITNATAFHQGAMVIAYHPSIYDSDQTFYVDKNKTLTLPNVIINASTSTSASLYVNYNNIRPWLSFGRLDRGALGHLALHILAPLTPTSGASSSVSINVILNIKNLKFQGFQNPQLNTSPDAGAFYDHVVPAMEMCQQCRGACHCTSHDTPEFKKEEGVVQGGGLFSGISSMLDGLFNGGIGDAVSSIFNEVGPMVAGFLDRPDRAEPPMHMRPTTATSFAAGTGSSDAQTLAFTPNLIDNTSHLNFKPLSLKSFVTREGLIGDIQIPANAAENQEIFNTYVHPVYGNKTHNLSEVWSLLTLWSNPLSYHTIPYRFWRGGIKYRFRFVGTSFFQCKVAIIWQPGNNQLTDLPGGWGANAGYLKHHIWDIKGSSETEFVVNFASENHWNCVVPLSTERNPDSTSWPPDNLNDVSPTPANNGTLHLVIVNRPVVQDGSPSNGRLLIFSSGAEDYEVACPITSNLRNIAISPPQYTIDNQTTNLDPQPDGMYNDQLTYPQTLTAPAPLTQRFGAPSYTQNMTGATVAMSSGDTDALEMNDELNQIHKDGQDDTQDNKAAENDSQICFQAPPENAGLITMGESHMDLTRTLTRKQWVGRIVYNGNIPRTNVSFNIPVTPAYRGNITYVQDIGGIPGITQSGFDFNGASLWQPVGWYHTLLSWHSAAATYWRGRLNFTVVASSSKPSGILSATYIPPGASKHTSETVGGYSEATDSYVNVAATGALAYTSSVRPTNDRTQPAGNIITSLNGLAVQDISVNPVLEVSVPWFNQRNYALCTHSDRAGKSSQVTSGDANQLYWYPGETNGFIQFNYVDNDTRSQADRDTIFDLYISAGDDFVLGFHHATPDTWSLYNQDL